MPLTITQKAYQYWSQRPEEYAIILLMSSKETWCEPDSEVLDAKLQELDATFDHAGEVDFENSPDFLKALASLSVGTHMYLMRRYEMAFPGAGSDLLKLAQSLLSHDAYRVYAEVIMRRFAVFERIKIFSKVFAIEKLQKVHDFLKNNQELIK